MSINCLQKRQNEKILLLKQCSRSVLLKRICSASDILSRQIITPNPYIIELLVDTGSYILSTSQISMANTVKNFMQIILVTWLLTVISLDSTVAQVGVCYGKLGNNLPSPEKAISLYKQNNILRMRLYAPHPPTLDALCNSGIDLMLGVPDSDLPNIANCKDSAKSWVAGNVTNYPGVKFRYIVVGNEISPKSEFAPSVLPAMRNIYEAICEAGYGSQISISTSVSTELIENSFPPKNGEFKPEVTPYVKPVLEFLEETRSPLLVSVYPYFAYRSDPVHINLSFALLQPNSGVCDDGSAYAGGGVCAGGGVYYDNLFYAIFDAMDAAVEKLVGPPACVDPEQAGDAAAAASDNRGQVGSESGWASKGVPVPPNSVSDAAADPSTVENARIYNNNLMRIVKNGTPRRPGQPIEAYIFAMFDENQKKLLGNDDSERHFGIFDASGKPKYKLRFY